MSNWDTLSKDACEQAVNGSSFMGSTKKKTIEEKKEHHQYVCECYVTEDGCQCERCGGMKICSSKCIVCFLPDKQEVASDTNVTSKELSKEICLIGLLEKGISSGGEEIEV